MNSNEIGNLDALIEQLVTCKPLKEADVKLICDKVWYILDNKYILGKRNI